MTIREATIDDIAAIQIVRNSVTENALSDPGLVTDADCQDYMTRRGKGWVCVAEGRIVGFAIADLQDDNIWALFLRPEAEGRGLGRQLHDTMMDWYFNQGKERAWLSTAPGTRAEGFYRRMGWQAVGLHGRNEIKFELTRNDWQAAPRNVINP